MAFQSFRSFLNALSEEGQLVTVHDPILPEPDIRTYLRAAVDLGDNAPAVIMDNIKGYKGYQVAGNVHGSWANHAILLGMNKNATIHEQFFEADRLWNSPKNGEMKWVDNAPSQEVIIEKNINLYEMMPLFRVNQHDGGCYFSKACVVSRDYFEPDNLEKENVGMYRCMVHGPDTLTVESLAFHDMARGLKGAEERNETAPIAICIGNPPLLAAMAATPLAYDQSEYKFASALMGEPFQVTKATGSNLNVPAGSEYIIEGEVIPRQRFCEGPFGDYTGSYSSFRLQRRVKVTRITHRRDPIFENLYIGRSWNEGDALMALWTSVPVYEQLKAEFPEVKSVNAFYQHGLTVIISADLRFGGFGKTLAFRMASIPHGISYAKNIIIVDGDVDPFNLNQVMWALSTRVRAHKDVSIITNTPGMPSDPSSEPPGMGNKLIIDATTPKTPDIYNECTMVINPPKSKEAMIRLMELQKAALQRGDR